MILIVEDERPWREKLKRYLESEGYVVETAASYGEALGKLLHGPSLDLAVIDLGLRWDEKNLDGMELVGDAGHQRIPVIVVTGRGTAEVARQAYEYGIIQFMDKATFDREIFTQVVRDAVAKEHQTELDSLNRQIYVHKQNLNELEEQKARHGMDPPIHLTHGIEYEQGQIIQKEARRKELMQKLANQSTE